ncbi:hypothetical protein [Lacihabitans soyangensis]|uniref:Uncharacterized protein n=1 Tax=Lacihabitans soyangensis TaxID=869394 RepID=A0AAE3H6X6_9BACT|nr:hypothetical protein [Lacihabitans soyangensis]MCP9766063.1 hypothetical protein [Lacihabitans soyangensis]
MNLTTEERIAHLEDFKTKDWLILDEWEDRDLSWPGDDVVEQMRLEIQDFTNFLIIHVKKEGVDLQAETQKYYDNWDTEYFENEEIEFIVEISQIAMKIAGINTDEIII